MQRQRTRHGVAGLLVAALAALTVLAPSPADASAPATAPPPTEATNGELRARAERACARIPNLSTRTSNLIERLEGDAARRGSLAWLATAIDRAEARSMTDLVEVLANRLAVREQTLEVLQLRSVALVRLGELCAERGDDL